MTDISENPNRLLKSKDAEVYLSLGYGALATWRNIKRPSQPEYIKTGRIVRYRLSDLDAWVEENKQIVTGTQ